MRGGGERDARDRVHGRTFPRLEENQEAHFTRYDTGDRLAVGG